MKKTAIAIAVALAGFATVAQAAPKDNTWYAGGKLGWSQYHDTGFINNNGPTHENQLGAGAYGGYQVNPYVGFELGYDWLGRMEYKGNYANGGQNGAYKAQGVQLTAKLTIWTSTPVWAAWYTVLTPLPTAQRVVIKTTTLV